MAKAPVKKAQAPEVEEVVEPVSTNFMAQPWPSDQWGRTVELKEAFRHLGNVSDPAVAKVVVACLETGLDWFQKRVQANRSEHEVSVKTLQAAREKELAHQNASIQARKEARVKELEAELAAAKGTVTKDPS